jgi:hypothetical protein
LPQTALGRWIMGTILIVLGVPVMMAILAFCP